MHRALSRLALLPLAFALPAAAQDEIAVGQTVEGSLSGEDPESPEGSRYDTWRFTARAGATYVISLRADDFDAYLWAGPGAGHHCGPCHADDDGGGGTDARLVLPALAAGPYVVRATSYGPGEGGRYLLTVEEAPAGAGAVAGLPAYVAETVVVDTSTITRAGPMLRPGVAGTGVLEEGDLRSEGAYFDVWLYQGRTGERLALSMRSDDVDAVLRVGRWVEGRWKELASDDDGGGGTDSELALILPADTRYEVHAAAFGEGETGAYTLTAASTPGAASVVTVPSGADLPFVLPGATTDGVLEAGDYVDEEGAFFDAYTYFASAGERATFELASDEFDMMLLIGTREGGEWRELARDDDEGRGTHAELTMTFPARADYEIRVSSYLAGQTGAYTLYSTSSIHAELDSVVPAGMIVSGQTVAGRLDPTDERGENGAWVDVWRIGAGGTAVTIDLRSEEFDPRLVVLRQREDGGWEEMASDDDGGVGTDSRLTIDLPHPGRYQIHVTSRHQGDGGEYTLSLRYGSP